MVKYRDLTVVHRRDIQCPCFVSVARTRDMQRAAGRARDTQSTSSKIHLEFGVFAVPFRNSVPVRLMRNGFLTFLRKRASVRTAKCGVAAHKIRESGARSLAHRLLPCTIQEETRRAKHVIAQLNVR